MGLVFVLEFFIHPPAKCGGGIVLAGLLRSPTSSFQPIQLAAIFRPYTRVRATVQETQVFDTCVRNGAVNRVGYYVCGSKDTI